MSKLKRKTKWTQEITDSNEFLQLVKMLSNYNPDDLNIRQMLLRHKCKHNSLLNGTQRTFLNATIASSDNKARAVWDLARMETNENVQQGDSFGVLRQAVCGAHGSDFELAQKLNIYYLSVVHNTPLRPNIEAAIGLLRENIPIVVHSFYLLPFSLNDVRKIIKNIKSKNTRDIYDIPTSILKNLPDCFLSYLCDLFNDCIGDGIYPEGLKKIKVTPIYKGKGCKKEFKSYRPISLVPTISKIFEAGICSRLSGYLGRNELLCDQQYAYQKGRSTVARTLHRTVLSHLENKLNVAAIYFDLSRAFDLVDHGLISAKLSHYGVRGLGLEVINSFLSDRRQATQVGGSKSEEDLVGDRSVPQGSNVGNCLFNLLMNDLPYASLFVDFVMYADDICAIVTGVTEQDLVANRQAVIERLSSWFLANGMQLNGDKTNLIHFKLRCDHSSPSLAVVTGNKQLVSSQCARFVGFTFDRGLQWSGHIDALCAKLNSAYYAIARLSRTFTLDNLLTTYYGYFHSYLTYGIDLWGLAADRDMPFVLQKKAIRMMCRVPADEPAKQLFVRLRVLTVPCIYLLEVVKYVRTHMDDFPASLRFSARRGNQLAPTRHRLEKTSKSLFVMGPKIFNKLPLYIREATSINVFINKCKRFLAEKAYYSVKEFIDE
ncbi:hypothetical protein O0L34_g18634 [Tuta absoluta]|nr:hypothetical protein O0L34_g18634 [Tuta absoluta]